MGQKRASIQDIRAAYKKKRTSKPSPAMVRQVRALIRRDQETKYFDTQITDTIAGTGSVQALNQIAEGTDDNERIGRRIRTKYIQYAGTIQIDTSSVGVSEGCWVALVCDHQANGATPAFSDIFVGQPGYEFKNVQVNAKRFKICWIERFGLNSAGPLNHVIDKFYAVPVDADGGDVDFGTTDIPTTNAYYLVGNNSSDTVPAAFQGTVRYAFTDA